MKNQRALQVYINKDIGVVSKLEFYDGKIIIKVKNMYGKSIKIKSITIIFYGVSIFYAKNICSFYYQDILKITINPILFNEGL